MPATILVVDDDESIREFIELALTDEGYHILLAQDGAQALDVATSNHVDLIILDMRMPVMDGWAFLKAYGDTPTPHAPVIAASANIRSIAGITVDVIDFIAKPFDLDYLLALIATRVQPPARNGQ